MGIYFGTDGIRGRVGDTLTAEVAFAVGRFLGAKGEHPRIAIGKDTRRSCDTLAHALAAGVAASGGDAFLLGVIPTPGVAFATHTGGYDFGVVISASHNPFADNGIKLFDRHGNKPDDATLAEAERFLQGAAPLPYATGTAVGIVCETAAEQERYARYLIEGSEPFSAGLRIGLDCANGAASAIAPRVFRALGAEVIAMHHHPDGQNINRNCGSTHVESLRRLVVEKRLAAGFAFDGDADRCIAVDELGNVLDGDAILYILARHMKSCGDLPQDTVVTTVMANVGLSLALGRHGIRCEPTAVGDRYVFERMQQGGYALGGEQSGHIIFGNRAGDGIQTALHLTHHLCRDGALSAQTEGFLRYPQVLKSVRIQNGEEALAEDTVRAAIAKAEQELGENGRILVRVSGTEPVVRVMVEAADAALCHTVAEEVSAALRERGSRP